ncbi:helix-turn-helix domain-containing protein [Streptomyces sp. NPDC051572]|uniref:TetR/AcrR family transcriptional regulator n=1 Tax=unclassified Streptomyces TaxID=2593676 RepID=UPI00345095D4
MAQRGEGGTGPRRGRPPRSEPQKAAVRLDIAREAVRLFAAQGVADTSVEEIARAAGVSVRTLWRHVASKEQCVRPLLTGGLDVTARLMREWPRDRPLRDAFGRTTLFPTPDATDTAALGDLVRLTRDEAGLRAVWLEVHHDAEPVFAQILAERAGRDPDDLEPRMQAVMLNGALRVAVEEWAWHRPDREDSGRADAISRTLHIALAGLPI